jgi:ATP-dependent protease ClpP protease subunit
MIENRVGMLKSINEHFFPDNDDVEQAFIYLRGEINIESCADVVETIVSLNFPQTDDEGDDVKLPDVINLFITSSGGDMAGALSLINVIRGSSIPVRTIALGEASSAALCILMAGHQRVVTPYTSLMSHQFLSGAEGSFDDLENVANAFREFHSKMLKLYVECTGLDTKFIKRKLLTSIDHHFGPDKAVEYNIVDLVCDLK